MALLDVFVGVPQSKYAAIAILVALGVVAIAMMVGKNEVPIGQKFMFVILMILIALPSVLLSLFQLTCLVTGAGFKNQRWWCSIYAWIGSVLIVIYSALVIVVGITAMVTGTSVTYQLHNSKLFEAMQNQANQEAREYFQVNKKDVKVNDEPIIDTSPVQEPNPLYQKAIINNAPVEMKQPVYDKAAPKDSQMMQLEPIPSKPLTERRLETPKKPVAKPPPPPPVKKIPPAPSMPESNSGLMTTGPVMQPLPSKPNKEAFTQFSYNTDVDAVEPFEEDRPETFANYSTAFY